MAFLLLGLCIRKIFTSVLVYVTFWNTELCITSPKLVYPNWRATLLAEMSPPSICTIQLLIKSVAESRPSWSKLLFTELRNRQIEYIITLMLNEFIFWFEREKIHVIGLKKHSTKWSTFHTKRILHTTLRYENLTSTFQSSDFCLRQDKTDNNRNSLSEFYQSQLVSKLASLFFAFGIEKYIRK